MQKMTLLALFLMCSSPVWADTTLTTFLSTIDLAGDVNDSFSVPAGSKIKITVINIAPGAHYNFSYEQYTVNPDPINTSGTFKEEPAKQGGVKGVLDTLPKSAVELLSAETEEKQVAARIAAANLEVAGIVDNGARALAQAELNEIIAKTTRTLEPDVVLAADQGLKFTIQRAEAGSAAKVWRRDFHVGGPGKFVSNYVFGFSPKRDDAFFSDPTTTGKFKITEQVRRNKVDFVPLVLFGWIPASKGNDPHIHSFAAGLGFDLSHLVVAGSYLYTWHRNLGLTIGVLAQQQQRLKGQYHSGQEVGQNLTSADLTEAVWRPNVFAGISIRSVSALFH
jgi:hypothetical protein